MSALHRKDKRRRYDKEKKIKDREIERNGGKFYAGTIK